MQHYYSSEDTHYCPYDDECWMRLAQAIMVQAANDYAMQFPSYAKSQQEYDSTDAKRYSNLRISILSRCKHGPLRNIINMPAVYTALEFRRKWNKLVFRVYWEDKWEVDVDQL